MIKFIKRYESDIGGRIFLRPKYKDVIPKIKRIRKKWDPFKRILHLHSKEKFLRRKKRTLNGVAFRNRQLLKCFYGLNYSKYRRILLFIKRSNSMANLNRFHSILESWLSTILLRSSFVVSIAQAKKYVRTGCIFVNGVVVEKPEYVLSSGDVVTFDKSLLFNLVRNVKYRFRSRRLFKFNKNIEVSFNNFTICYIKDLLLNERSYIFDKVNINKVPHI
jgi:ribosomal protein S4